MGATGVRMRLNEGAGPVRGQDPEGGLGRFSGGGIHSVTAECGGVRAEPESAGPGDFFRDTLGYGEIGFFNCSVSE